VFVDILRFCGRNIKNFQCFVLQVHHQKASFRRNKFTFTRWVPDGHFNFYRNRLHLLLGPKRFPASKVIVAWTKKIRSGWCFFHVILLKISSITRWFFDEIHDFFRTFHDVVCTYRYCWEVQ
jgi:hypothetical protein